MGHRMSFHSAIRSVTKGKTAYNWRLRVVPLAALSLTVLCGSVAAGEPIGLDAVVVDLVNCIQRSLEQRQITKLAVTRIYYNGSATAPVAKFIQRKVVGGLLNIPGSDLEIMERQDLRLMVEENALQWMIEGKTVPGFAASHAILTGEILWDKGLGQALLSLRVIDTATGQLICAPARVTALSPDLRERLGVPDTEPPGADMLIAKPSVDLAAMDLTTKLVGMKTRVSLAGPDSIPEKYRFAYRVLSALLADHFTSRGLIVLERELLFQISGEQAASQKEINTILLGDIILQVELDESTGIDFPVFFARAVRREDGKLLAQSEFRLMRTATPLRTQGTAAGRMGTLAAEEALAEVVAAHRRASDVRASDPLVFTESFRLGTSMQIDEKTRRLFENKSLWYLSDDMRNIYCDQKLHEEAFDGFVVFDSFIQALIPVEQNDTVLALKADLLAFAAAGFRYEGKVFPGPLAVLARRIASQYTVRRDLRPAPDYWDYMLLRAHDSFFWQWYGSMHPKYRKAMRSPIDAVKGRCNVEKVSPALESYVIGAADNQSAVFDYTVKCNWSGRYPSEVTITIDLTPMKDRLKRVKPAETTQR